MSEQEWEDKLEEVQKHSEHWYEMYTKQKEINKGYVDENESLKSQIEKMKSDVKECFGYEYNILVAKLLNKWEVKENG